jgi:hypothetical protein
VAETAAFERQASLLVRNVQQRRADLRSPAQRRVRGDAQSRGVDRGVPGIFFSKLQFNKRRL